MQSQVRMGAVHAQVCAGTCSAQPALIGCSRHQRRSAVPTAWLCLPTALMREFIDKVGAQKVVAIVTGASPGSLHCQGWRCLLYDALPLVLLSVLCWRCCGAAAAGHRVLWWYHVCLPPCFSCR